MTLDDLCEELPIERRPYLDRPGVEPLTIWQTEWQSSGVVYLPKVLPDDLIDAYCESYPPGGYGIGTPYLENEALRKLSLYPSVMKVIEHIIGEVAGLHLNLTGWTTTAREWHQDSYLNPLHAGVDTFYAATWMALADIHPDSGPFQYVAGSHKWPLISQRKMLAAMGEDGSDPDWPWRSEQILKPIVEAKIEAEGWKVETYLPKRGDCLIWSSRLMHRGSRANVEGMERRALISHYSGLNHRRDMPRRATDENGQLYFIP